VVWCGVVWCGVVWCGVVWCGVVWCGVVGCGGVCGAVQWPPTTASQQPLQPGTPTLRRTALARARAAHHVGGQLGALLVRQQRLQVLAALVVGGLLVELAGVDDLAGGAGRGRGGAGAARRGPRGAADKRGGAAAQLRSVAGQRGIIATSAPAQQPQQPQQPPSSPSPAPQQPPSSPSPAHLVGHVDLLLLDQVAHQRLNRVQVQPPVALHVQLPQRPLAGGREHCGAGRRRRRRFRGLCVLLVGEQ
jgi:hypothetical protein